MRIISGEFYDIQEGLEKASELDKALFDELGSDLARVLSNIHKAQEQLERDLAKEDWERGKEDREKLQAKIDADKRTRKTMFYAVIVLAMMIPTIALVSSRVSAIKSGYLVLFSSFLMLLSCAIPVFLFACLLVVFIYSLSITTKKSRLRSSLPQRREFSYIDTDPSSMINLSGELASCLKKIQKPIHGNNNHGLQGEERLVQRLGMMLNDDYICVRGLLVDNKLDADVLIVGPSGIWILESKYISGRIFKECYGWRREKTYFETGGYLASKNNRLEDFEEQWKREKAAVVRALRNNGLIPHQIPVNKIKGGIVFTHHNSVLVLNEPSSVEVGNLDRWCEKISSEKENRALTDQQARNAVSAILQHSSRFNPNSKSALTEIEVRYHHKREYLLAFIERNQSIEVYDPVYLGAS